MRTGLVTGVGTGLLSGLNARAGAAVAYAIDTLTPSDVATITGLDAPVFMVRGNDATGAIELVSGVDNLSDVGTPVHSVTSATLGGVVTTFDSIDDALAAAGDTVLDMTDEAFACCWIGKFSTAATGLMSVFGKRDGTTPFHGYEINHNQDDYLDWTVNSATGAVNRRVTAAFGNTAAEVILATKKKVANVQALHTRLGSSSGGRHDETITNTATFSIGKGRLNGELQDFGAFWVWKTTAAEAADDTHRVLVAQALGYE